MTETLREELDLYCDEGLDADARGRLDSRLAAEPELRRERQELEALHGLLRSARLEPRADFQARVLAALPPPAWARKSKGFTLHLPFAALLAFGLGGALLLGGLPETTAAGTGAALVDFLQTTVLAGAGMLAASWIGLGASVRALMADSVLTFGLSFAFVAFLDLLLLSLLQGPAPETPHEILKDPAPADSDRS